MPRAFSSGALSIWSYAVNVAPPVSARTFVIAAVRDVLPWSTWPIVPMLQCGLLRSNFAFAIFILLLRLQGFRDRLRNRVIVVKLHGVLRAALGHGAQRVDVTKHAGQRDHRGHDLRVAAGVGALHLTAAAVQVADDAAEEVFGGHNF